MTSFVPLNIIPDSDSEGEVDNTEEIQIEEALKLYQRALKLHTDGAWEEANKAYDDLFQSEIFQLDVEDQVHSQNRTVSSSLPLVHYLAYKNHGRFKLDRLKTVLPNTSPEDVHAEVAQALEWFAIALGRDAGDSFLWRETAQLALVISSARLARFALESVLDHQTVGADAAKDSLSLVVGGYQNPEDQVALVQLREILGKMADTVALSNPKVNSTSKRKLNSKFMKALKPLPWLPQPRPDENKTLAEAMEAFSETRETVAANARTWPAVGQALLESIPRWVDEDELPEFPTGATTIQIVLPAQEGDESRDTSPEEETPPETQTKPVEAEDNEDVTMVDAAHTLLAHELLDRRRSGSANRKRKSTSMGPDTARSRLSKRQRDKKEADAAAAAAAAATPESTLKGGLGTQAEKLFNVVYDCFSPFGLSLGSATALKIRAASDTDGSETSESDKCDLYIEDFKAIIQSWNDAKGNVILYGEGIQSPAEAAQGMKFLDLEPTISGRPLLTGDEGLKTFVRGVHKRGLDSAQAAFEWVRTLCRRAPEAKKSKHPSPSAGQASYLKHDWPEALKATVTAIASGSEEICLRYFRAVEKTALRRETPEFTAEDYADVEWAETMLEIYIDELAALERLRSGGDLNGDSQDELVIGRDRVFRWFQLVGDLIQLRPRNKDGQIKEDQLTLRYLWASAVVTSFSEPSKEFRLACFEDLKNLMSSHPAIDLPNCSVMPEVSAARAERELSKLKTVDFFQTIFMTTDDTDKDPEDVIDLLEAVLYPGAVLPYDEEEERILLEINRFLEGSKSMFKLYLWEKLRAAYEKIQDTPKVLSCIWKCMGIVMSELESRSYKESPQEYRQFMVLRSIRLVKQMIETTLEHVLTDPMILDQLSGDDAVGAMKSIMSLLKIVHCYTLWESQVLKSEAKSSDTHSYRLMQGILRELLVRGWVLVYHLYASLLRRGLGCEDGGEWEDGAREEKLFSLLRELHEELGSRNYCKLCDHMFLKLMYDEIIRFDDHTLDGDFVQCLNCRFHLTFCSDLYYLHDHKTDAEPLTKPIAMQLLDFVMYLAKQKKVKELVKSDIKIALDKLVEVLGVPQRIRGNRVAYNEAMIDIYLKQSLSPLRLHGSLKGVGSVSTVMVTGDHKVMADKGVYFLLGKITMYPLKAVKIKTASAKVEDIEATIKYFKNDLVCKPESWESWYRLAQVYELQMDEMQTWSADAMNTKREELVVLERRCILAYLMAVALAIRSEDESTDDDQTISELFSDFGFRMYSASRPPMAMESFWLDGFERHFSGRRGQGMFISSPHKEVKLLTALQYTFRLFTLSAACAPSPNWKTHYMLGKCLSKIDTLQRAAPPVQDDDDADSSREDTAPRRPPRTTPPIEAIEILQHFITAISHAPEKSGGDHVFEPHHKLCSATTKFVLASRVTPTEACAILQATHFAKRIPPVSTHDEFIPYAIELFKKLKAADKPKWHHRMTARLAHLKYDQLADIPGARAEVASLFGPKTAQISIWRPENERPGRHFVFASHYTMFYATILKQLSDRATLEMLAKRTRKGTTALFRHADVWAHVFDAYICTLRDSASLPVNTEDRVFGKLAIEEFAATAAKIEAFFLSPANQVSKPLELLRETFELRKLNAALAKNTGIDDLLADAYAWVYETTQPRLEVERKDERMSLKNLIVTQTEEAGGVKGMRVARRDVVSKAGMLCKELNSVREVGREVGEESRVEVGEESRIEESRVEEDSRMEDVESAVEGGDEGEGGPDEMMLG